MQHNEPTYQMKGFDMSCVKTVVRLHHTNFTLKTQLGSLYTMSCIYKSDTSNHKCCRVGHVIMRNDPSTPHIHGYTVLWYVPFPNIQTHSSIKYTLYPWYSCLSHTSSVGLGGGVFACLTCACGGISWAGRSPLMSSSIGSEVAVSLRCGELSTL